MLNPVIKYAQMLRKYDVARFMWKCINMMSDEYQ